ncbi:MAG: PEP-CTERM sorting domain-containing protein [Sedimentisphaerales bacterium]|jgi:hypothetical protein
MRRISLLAIMGIALINYAKGDVTITATDAGGGKLQIGYQATGTLAPVAFALDIQLSNGATFSSVTPLTQCFSYYPGSFRDYIIPQNPNWENPYYLPVAPNYDPFALGGLSTSGVTIEMASMLDPYLANSNADFDADGIINLMDSSIFSDQWLTNGGMADLDGDGLVNFHDYAVFLDGHFDTTPALSGDILLLQLNGNGAEITTANISLNLIRGGIVLEDASFGNAILPTNVTVVVPEPATLFLLTLACPLGGGLFLRRRKV